MERLTTSKLIRDLSGRPPEPFFGESWQKENEFDILLAKEQTRQARAEQEEKVNCDRLKSKVQIGGEQETATPKEKN
jgi:hypothetical protein